MPDTNLVRLARRVDGSLAWGPWHILPAAPTTPSPDALCGRSSYSAQPKQLRETRLDVGAVQGKRCAKCAALEAARRAAGLAQLETVACTVTWDRIGRAHPLPYDIAVPAAFDQKAMDALTGELYAYARSRLGSRDWYIDVTLDPDTWEGEVLLAGGRFGRGSIARKPA